MIKRMLDRLEGFNPTQRYIFLTVIIIIIAAPYYFLFFQKHMEEQKQLRKDIQRLEKKIKDGRTIEAKLPQFEREYKSILAQTRETLKVLPERQDMQKLVKSIAEKTQQSEIRLETFDPQAPVRKSFYGIVPIKITITSRFHRLGEFFQNIASDDRIVVIKDLKLRAVKGVKLKGNFTAKALWFDKKAITGGEKGRRKRR